MFSWSVIASLVLVESWNCFVASHRAEMKPLFGELNPGFFFRFPRFDALKDMLKT
jgi:hypothetical protein